MERPEAAPGDFFALLKPRVLSLVVFSGLAGLLVAPGDIHPLIAAVAVLCVGVGAGASGAINMWYDRDIDAVMERTRQRPIPMGRVAPGDALGFGVVLATGAVALMGLAVNFTAAALLTVAIMFYVFVYTMWLKRRTPQNIVIGGAAGAFPPMIGWAAVTGSVSIEPFLLFALIFFWTPPHFWALALYRDGDYAKAGIPMLPVVVGKTETKKQMILYTVLLIPLGIAPVWFGFVGWVYGAAATALGFVFLAAAIAVWFDRTDRSAKRMFGYSIFYLFAIFAVMVADATLGLSG
ncbi:MAG: protoheme IX farnesyltransferase [Rhodospirillaceae bacterium]|nr:protoheme IX farnesyltransferase [Rhodospirillaceae bacterium]